VYIAAMEEFTEHPRVADVASELLRDVLEAERGPFRPESVKGRLPT
jgi:hypothetical protein